MKQQYYGDKKIFEIRDLDDDLELVFVAGTKEAGEDIVSEVIPKKMLPFVLTDEKSDMTSLRERRIEPMVKDVMDVLLSWNVKPFDPMNELEYVTTQVIASFNLALDRAWDKQWKKPKSQVTIRDIDNVLKSNAGEEVSS